MWISSTMTLPLHGPGQDRFHEVGGRRDADARMIDEIALPGDVQAADQVGGRSFIGAGSDAAQRYGIPFAARPFLGGKVGIHAPEIVLRENDLQRPAGPAPFLAVITLNLRRSGIGAVLQHLAERSGQHQVKRDKKRHQVVFLPGPR